MWKKCNVLIDKLRAAESEKSLLMKENSSMKEYLKGMKKSGKLDSAISMINTESAALSELRKFVKEFVLIVVKAIEHEMYAASIKYKNIVTKVIRKQGNFSFHTYATHK